jgi:xylulokinase
MSASFSLGIDLGTTSVKLLALGRDGQVLAVSNSHHGIDDTSEGVQADPEMWWQSLLTALGDLGRQVRLADAVAVGFSGNMSSVVLVDDHAVALAPALLLADPRGAEQIAALTDRQRARIVAVTGNVPNSVFSLASLLWWNATHRDVLQRASVWLSAKDYLRARLTGVLATDPTDAYNSLLVDEGTWNRDLIESLGLPGTLFPPLIGSFSPAGAVHRAAAQLTGLREGTPVATGSGDVAAAITGMGGLHGDQLAISLGTSATVMAALDDGLHPSPPTDAVGAMSVHPASNGMWFALGSLLTGGLALNWLRSIAGAESITSAQSTPNAANPLVFLPYLAGTGSPDFLPSATGTILGVMPSTTASQLVAALCEAVAFDIAGLVERLGSQHYSHVVVSGGGSRVQAWPQILADVLRLPVRVLDQPDLSAVGAAMYGWAALGITVSPTSAGSTAEPRASTAAAWEIRRGRYEKARTLALELNTRLVSP